MKKKKRFRKSVANFAQVSDNMELLAKHGREVADWMEDMRKEYDRLCRSLNWRRLRNAYPKGGGGSGGTAPRPPGWPP